MLLYKYICFLFSNSSKSTTKILFTLFFLQPQIIAFVCARKIQRRYLSPLMQFVVVVNCHVLVTVLFRTGIVPGVNVLWQQRETASKSFRFGCRIKTAPVTFLRRFVRLHPALHLVHPLRQREIQVGLVLDAAFLLKDRQWQSHGFQQKSQREKDD